MFRNTFFFIILLQLFLSYNAKSQLVNTESSRKERKEGIQGNVSLAYSFAKTTTEIFQLQNNAGLQYTKGKHTYLLLNSIEFMRLKTTTEQSDLANQNFQHFRYNYNFRDTSAIIWEYFLQHQKNKIKYQDLRIVTGTGPRIRLLEGDRLTLFICPLVMYEHELERETATETVETHVFKGDLYWVVIFRITDEFTFRNVTYYQPSLVDFANSADFEPINDYRISSETALTFKIFKKRLEFSALFNFSHDSRPPGLYKLESGNNMMTFFEIKNEIRLNF